MTFAEKYPPKNRVVEREKRRMFREDMKAMRANQVSVGVVMTGAMAV